MMSSELTLWRDEGFHLLTLTYMTSSLRYDGSNLLIQMMMMMMMSVHTYTERFSVRSEAVNTITLTLMLSICSLCGADIRLYTQGGGEGATR